MRAPFTFRPISWRVAALFAALTVLSWATAQFGLAATAFTRGDVVYVEVTKLARALGVVVHADGGVLTWRGPFGPVTLFAGSPDALAQVPGQPGAADVVLLADVLELGSGWFVPLDALPLLGIDVPMDASRPEQLEMPDGSSLPLEYVSAESLGLDPAARPLATDGAPFAPVYSGRASWEATEAPLVGVRFFDGDGVSLLLVDLTLVPLAQPELTGQVDAVLERARQAGSDHVLLLMVTALEHLPWSPALVFEQDGRRLEVRPPYRMLIESGEPGSVSAEAPVLGAVLLPSSFSLYRPMHVSWAGAQAEVRFRR